MAFDGVTIAAIVKELNDTCLGGRLYKIAQPESDELPKSMLCLLSSMMWKMQIVIDRAGGYHL